MLSTKLGVIYIAIRVAIANKAPITDCDEVFNYWEPVHFLFQGHGLQTWEYAPQYALRTYIYLLPMVVLSFIYQHIISILPSPLLQLLTKLLVNPSAYSSITENNYELLGENKVLIFQLMRCTLSCITALSELRLCNALQNAKESTQHFNSHPKTTCVGIWSLFILLTSAGMFHSSPAYLPSATAMIFWMNSASVQLRALSCKHISEKSLDGAILWGLLVVLTTGWPFCAVLFIPLGLIAMYRAGFCQMSKQNEEATPATSQQPSKINFSAIFHLLIRTMFHAILVQGGVMVVDYFYYGKITSPTVNIFIYNTGLFGDDVNRDELYGVEDVGYYIKNLLLNWNFNAIFGFLSLPLLLLRRLIQRGKGYNTSWTFESVLLPMYIWVFIMFTRPHKEERFLFPIYPMIAIGSAICLEEIFESLCVYKLFIRQSKNGEDQDSQTQCLKIRNTNLVLGILALTPTALISISRCMALHYNYIAPMDTYTHLYHYIQSKIDLGPSTSTDTAETMLVCTGGEWYRFPSAYHLPNNMRLAFLKSSFDGQLPQQFSEYGSKEESLVYQKGTFNDMNEEEMDRYVRLQDCSFVVELLENDITSLSPREWKNISKFQFLNVKETSMLNRLLYIPMLRKVKYDTYSVSERRDRN